MIDKLYELLTKIGITKSQDKVLHILAGLIITIAVGFALTVSHGVLAGVIAGLAKELYDQYDYNGFDFLDLLATYAGVCIGGAVVVLAS